jgi:hypothetical protein
VIDPHLLRVLDCDDEDGTTWVVNEWGDGISLDLMLQQGTLPPSRAAWLTREVAEAIAAGHARGVAHGRLNPEAVLVTHAGAVKLIGYVVDASLQHPRPPDPLYGELDDREADVINLAGILYAALTGRWPGVAHSSVPRAPRESRRPLRPRQVRAGVPRTLDAICERVLHKEASQHAMPIETAHEIAAALADYVGDPALSAPIDAAGMHAEPAAAVRHDVLPSPLSDLTARQSSPAGPPPADQNEHEHDPDATQLAVPVAADPESTQLSAAIDADSGDATQAFHAPETHHPPPAPFPDLPERPLYATTERRVPTGPRAVQPPVSSPWARSDDDGHAGAAATGASALNGGDGGPPGQAGFWPFVEDAEEDNGAHTGKEGRGWLRTAIVVSVLLVLVVAMAIAFNQGRDDGGTPGAAEPGSTSTAEPRGSVIELAGVRDFDPLADPPEENPDTAPNAIDGDPSTTWTTSTYRGNAALGGLKPGVGLMVDLGSDQEVSSVAVRFKGSPTSFEVYAAPTGVTESPESLEQLDKVGSRADAPERATVELESTPKTRYVLVWLTKLPPVSGGFRGEIADITVTS